MTGKPYDEAALQTQTSEAVRAIVVKQAELGIDIVSDGEQSKASFQHYVTTRLSGLSESTSDMSERRTRENIAFPAFYKNGAHSGSAPARWSCTGPISYVGHDDLQSDIANFKAALSDQAPIDAFMPSVSPSSCVGLMTNRYYKTDEEHVFAVAEALRHEYEAIVDAGLCVQIDDPRLAMHYMLSPDESVDEARRWARQRIEALNHALRNIPAERIRHHTAMGSIWGRERATSKCAIWRICSSRSKLAIILSKWRTPATNTNGVFGKMSDCRRVANLRRGSSLKRRSSSSILTSSPREYLDWLRSSDAKMSSRAPIAASHPT
jgi:methionine synthase II (cobalamin-independent)